MLAACYSTVTFRKAITENMTFNTIAPFLSTEKYLNHF